MIVLNRKPIPQICLLLAFDMFPNFTGYFLCFNRKYTHAGKDREAKRELYAFVRLVMRRVLNPDAKGRVMKHVKSIVASISIFFFGLCATGCETNDVVTESQGEQNTVEDRMKVVVAYLDSEEYRNQTTFDEHIVKTYQAVQERDPSAWEMQLWQAMKSEFDIPRSAVLARVLRGADAKTSWDSCRQFVTSRGIESFRKSASASDVASRLISVPRDVAFAEMALAAPKTMEKKLTADISRSAVPGEEYQTYFGFLHAHTAYSDGEGTPDEAYAYARDVAVLDFFAVTDHGEMLDWWPWEHEWRSIKEAADSADSPGSFVALWGFEWSNPLLGHINVINTADFTDALSDSWLGGVYNWIAERPAAFARFNHPGDYDSIGQEFYHMDLYPQVVDQMVGMELWNGSKSFDEYFYDSGWKSDYSFVDEGNQRGWRLGALGAEDNHDKSWGTKTDYATAVLATALTREAIVSAYRERRFYATEDRDLFMDVRCQGYPMGAVLSGVTRTFQVSSTDTGGDIFSEVRLYRNGSLINTVPVSGDDIVVDISDNHADPAYYYVIVKQNDDSDGNGRNDEAISSPIWID